MTKPKVDTTPVANRYTGRDERIVEYSSASGLGGLIAFREVEGRLIVELYRHDADVEIRVADKPGPVLTERSLDLIEVALDSAISATSFALGSGDTSDLSQEYQTAQREVSRLREHHYPTNPRGDRP